MSLLDRFLAWVETTPNVYDVVTFAGTHHFRRYAPFWPDEHRRRGMTWNRPPWWRPFNVLFHNWNPEPGTEEDFHDHPRWSITVCLRGRIIEKTPWGDRLLRPGSVVIRSRKAIHAFKLEDEHHGKTWTMFIVGRRNYPQNTYVITPQGSI